MADMVELGEALDALLASDRELKRLRRALFPAVLARRRATTRVLAVWREMRGQAPVDPDADRPLFRTEEGRRNGSPGHAEAHAAPAVIEERPDGSRPRPTTSIVAAPPQGWCPRTLYDAARLILGDDPDPDQLNDLVVCRGRKCGCLRYCPIGERIAARCPVCKGKQWLAYSIAAGEFIRRQERMGRKGLDLVTSRPNSTPSANGHPELEPDLVEKPAGQSRKRKAVTA